ncbi:MAG: DUF2089 domain-containing protein [Anaerolineaceae bacterium]
MPNLPDTCPLCQSKVIVTRLYCPNCETTLEGYFQREQDPFAQLNKDQREFLLSFVRSEGRLNRLEESLGISYPTLKNRLTEVIHALGFETEKQPLSPAPDRQQILEDLENGLIDAEEALALLQPSSSNPAS